MRSTLVLVLGIITLNSMLSALKNLIEKRNLRLLLEGLVVLLWLVLLMVFTHIIEVKFQFVYLHVTTLLVALFIERLAYAQKNNKHLWVLPRQIENKYLVQILLIGLLFIVTCKTYHLAYHANPCQQLYNRISQIRTTNNDFFPADSVNKKPCWTTNSMPKTKFDESKDDEYARAFRYARQSVDYNYGQYAFQKGFDSVRRNKEHNTYEFRVSPDIKTNLLVTVKFDTPPKIFLERKVDLTNDTDIVTTYLTGLPLAIALASDKVDAKYGKNAFLHGLRRILKDVDKISYAFQVKIGHGQSHTNLVVNVDMTKTPHEAKIDFAEKYRFKGDWAF